MSYALTPADLSTAAAGSTGFIDLKNVGIGAGGVSANPSTTENQSSLYLFNDSGAGLILQFDIGSSFSLPAGAWKAVPLPLGASKLKYVVQYVLPNPPVSTLFIDYYGPGEDIPNHTLGNSPVGIGGSVQTSSVQTLSNEGNPSNTLVADIGDSALAQLWKIFAGNFSISVDQSSVAHTVLQGVSSGNPLKIGQAGDTSEVLGKLTVDQLLTAALGLTISATGLTVAAGGASITGGAITDNLTVNGTTTTGAINASIGSPPTLNGVTSGTLTIFQTLIGSVKVALFIYNNFRNGGGSTQSLALSTAFAGKSFFLCTDVPGFNMNLSGVAVGAHIITTLASGGGTTVSQPGISSYSIGGIDGAFDAIICSSGNASAHTGIVIVIGS